MVPDGMAVTATNPVTTSDPAATPAAMVGVVRPKNRNALGCLKHSGAIFYRYPRLD